MPPGVTETLFLKEIFMKIDYFRKNFIDHLEECNRGATIELDSSDRFQTKVVYDYKIVGSKMILLTSVSKIPHIFLYKSIFNGVESVVFLVDGNEVSDFTLDDVSWSDRIFTFVGEF